MGLVCGFGVAEIGRPYFYILFLTNLALFWKFI